LKRCAMEAMRQVLAILNGNSPGHVQSSRDCAGNEPAMKRRLSLITALRGGPPLLYNGPLSSTQGARN